LIFKFLGIIVLVGSIVILGIGVLLFFEDGENEY